MTPELEALRGELMEAQEAIRVLAAHATWARNHDGLSGHQSDDLIKRRRLGTKAPYNIDFLDGVMALRAALELPAIKRAFEAR